MGEGKRLHLHPADGHIAPKGMQALGRQEIAPGQRRDGSGAAVHGKRHFPQQGGQSRHMIPMLVGKKHPVQRLQGHSQRRQALFKAPQTDAHIQQEARPIHFHKNGVALAAAGQNRKPHLSPIPPRKAPFS